MPDPLILSEGWVLGYDRNQWMLMRLKRRKKGEETYWQPVAFIGSDKTTLLRLSAENGVTICQDAKAAIDAMPERFLDWIKAPTWGKGGNDVEKRA